MKDRQFLRGYFKKCQDLLMTADVENELIRLKHMLVAAHLAGKKMIVAGNGGSAAVASHCAIDFSKTAKIRCVNFNEPSLITCLANDYGYERWLEKALEFYADEGDVAVLISSSGQSSNMIRAADYALHTGLTLVTFSGFSANNPLRIRGHLNFWVQSKSYNFVEMLHQFWLLSVCDLIAATVTSGLHRNADTASNVQPSSPLVPTAA